MQQQQQQQPQHSRYNSARLTIGDVVLISDPSEGIGVVRHIDEISFIVGIELTDPLGTSDGVRDNERYFRCRPRYGIFVSVSDIVRLVSPEELLHKIVVLNRALAHKHSTLTSKNQIIDNLEKEIISLKQALSINIVNQQNWSKEIQKLKAQLDGQTSAHLNGNTPHKLKVRPQTLNRESKPQTPDCNTSEEEEEDVEPKKPRSRPPSRRGSFLSEYTHHLYGNDIINRELILNRGKKLNQDLLNYSLKKQKDVKKKKKKIKKNKHSRDISNEQLVFHHAHAGISPISSHHSNTSLQSNHSQKQKHRKQRSNVEEAAMKLREEINAKSKEMMMAYGDEEDTENNEAEEAEEADDELLSDEYFVEMSNKYNAPKYKRFSRSQPVSPRHYYHDEFNFGLIAHHNNNNNNNNNNNVDMNAYRPPPLTPTLNTSYSNKPHSYSRSAHFKPKYQINHDLPSQQPLKATSVWRKNREAFLKQMDKKLEEVMNKFESKNTAHSGQMPQPRIAGKFRSKPLIRKRGYSYHQNSVEMQQVIAERQREREREMASQPNGKYEWLTTKTTFSKYNDRLSKNDIINEESKENKEEEMDAMDGNEFNMMPRRSLSLPSSPKHCDSMSGNFVDTLDLGDDEHNEEEEEEQEQEQEQEQDVLDNSQLSTHSQSHSASSQTAHISDESSISNDVAVNNTAAENDRSNLYLRKESEPIQYDRRFQRRRLRQRLKTRNRMKKRNRRYNEVSSSNSDDDDSDDFNTTRNRIKQRRNRYQYKDDSDDNESDKESEEDGDHNDNDDEMYKYYETRKRKSQIHLLDKDEFEREYNSILQ